MHRNILYIIISLWVIVSSLVFAWYTSWYYIRDAFCYMMIQGISIVLMIYAYRKKHFAMPLLYLVTYIITIALFIYNFSLFSSVRPLYRTCFVLFLFFFSFILIDMGIRSYISSKKINIAGGRGGGRSRFRTLVLFILYILYLTISSIPCAMLIYFITFNAKITAETFFPLFQTNLYEVYEFSTSVFPLSLWIIVVISLYVVWIYTKQPVSYLGKRTTRLVIILGILLFVVLIVGNVQRHILLFSVYKDSKSLYTMVPHTYTLQRADYLRSFHTKAKKGNGLYVIVIGESATRQGFPDYGYYRKTTPFISGTLQKQNAFLIDNVYSSATSTELSVFAMLTNQSQYEEEKRRVSLLDILQVAGMKVIWVTNQSMLDRTNQQVKAVAEQADVVISDKGGIVSFAQYDEMLLPHIENVLNHKIGEDENVVLFIHLYGSHINYCRRYDKKKYSIFTDKPQYVQSDNYDDINCYDNSIYATDDLLKHIMERVSKKKNFQMLLYVSDHGEGVYKGKPRGNPESLQDVLRVPLYIYMQDTYIENNKERVAILQANKNKGYTTDMLFHTLLGLIGVESTSYDAQYDISSSQYAYKYDNIKTLSGNIYVKEIMQ